MDRGREQAVYRDYVHLGAVVDAPRGLLVPVVRTADRRSVRDVHGAPADAAGKARKGKLGAAAMHGAAFTLSNLGGVCLYRGCIPSRALLHAAELFFGASTHFYGKP